MALVDSFEQVNPTGDAIGARMQHKTVVHRGQLVVMMGYNGTSRLGDLNISNNGRYWRKIPSLVDTKGATIVGREAFGLVNHDEKICLMGGYDGSNYLRDVYISGNAISWTKMIDAPWSTRYGFVVLSFDQRVWVLGGINASGTRLNDVWWTRDFANWTQEPNAPWAIRGYHAGLVYNNMMYIIGGLGAASRYNDVWYSPDGRNWTRLEASAAFTGRDGHMVASFGDHPDRGVQSRMVLTGGQTGAGSYSAEVWHSGAGHQWKLGDSAMPMGNLRGHTMTWFDNRLFVIGGLNGAATYRGEIWTTQGEFFRVP
jgi:hypothetical protein